MSDNKTFKKKRRKFDTRKKYGVKKKPWQIIDDEIATLSERIKQVNASAVSTFPDFPLSQKTLKGLTEAKYHSPTDIQRQSIGLALQGHDILGAAKTGSGKTLAFLIPVIEKLFHLKWSAADGLGALIISPTRELAYQTFEVLRHVGKVHDFSAGLVIGGKHLREEAERINRTNIVICTPGRLLQHMDQTVHFTADNLQILVLDEADRILDLGFEETMNAIIQNLPPVRQTLLYSATQTKSVRDLARLSLKNPMYVSVHENAQHSTPSQLRQSYVVCDLHNKFDLLWSFLKHHLKHKILIFLSSCKQVRYVYEAVKKLRPGNTVLALHGAMQQMKRMAVYEQFCRKQHAVLFATDVAARGLDFPAVHWVIQMDCPEDSSTYIHRAGRTARYEKDGESLLLLLPSEEKSMVEQLNKRKIPIEKISINPRKQLKIQSKLESICAADVRLKEFAQRAFVSYLKSVFLMSDKTVFDVTQLNTDLYARSLGLAVPPRIRFIQKKLKQASSSSSMSKERLDASTVEHRDPDGSTLNRDPDGSTMTVEGKEETFSFGVDDSDDDEILTVKKTSETIDDDDNNDSDDISTTTTTTTTLPGVVEQGQSSLGGLKKSGPITKYAVVKKILKKKLKVNSKVLFDDDGQEIPDVHRKAQTVTEQTVEGGINVDEAKRWLETEDKFDKQLYREKIKKKHRERRLKEKRRQQKRQETSEEDEGQPSSDDQIYSCHDDEEADDSDEHSTQDEDDESSGSDLPVRKRPKLKVAKTQSESETDNELDTGRTLAEDEALALKLLRS